MKEYKVVAVLWNDHTTVERSELPKKPDSIVCQTLTFGFIWKETKKSITLVHDLERYEDHRDASYMIILKGTITDIREYGTIKLAI